MGDGWDYYVTTTAWKEICAGLDPRRTAAMLKQKGYLDAEGKHTSRSPFASPIRKDAPLSPPLNLPGGCK